MCGFGLNPLETWNCFQTRFKKNIYWQIIDVLIHLKRGTAFRPLTKRYRYEVHIRLNPLETWNCFQTLIKGKKNETRICLNPLETWNCFQTREKDLYDLWSGTS